MDMILPVEKNMLLRFNYKCVQYENFKNFLIEFIIVLRPSIVQQLYILHLLVKWESLCQDLVNYLASWWYYIHS